MAYQMETHGPMHCAPVVIESFETHDWPRETYMLWRTQNSEWFVAYYTGDMLRSDALVPRKTILKLARRFRRNPGRYYQVRGNISDNRWTKFFLGKEQAND